MIFKKSIDALLKVFTLTFYCVALYFIFIVASLIRQIAEDNIDFVLFPKFNPNFSNVAGAFALSFLIHPTAAPILKKNIKQSNNQRDLLLGYCLTASIYFFVGFFGGLSCSNKVKDIVNNPGNYNTIFDCTKDTETTSDLVFYIFGRVVQFGIFIQNLTVLPILNFLARKDLLEMINSKKHSNKLFYIETIALLVLCGGVSILRVPISYILSFDGAIIGFFMAYGIPIYMHFKCYHGSMTKEERTMRASLISSN